jgi:hypothetical protein
VSLLPCGIETCGGTGGDDKLSGPSPTGAASDNDDDTANDASRSEELDGNLMKNDLSGRNRGKSLRAHPLYIKVIPTRRIDVGQKKEGPRGR